MDKQFIIVPETEKTKKRALPINQPTMKRNRKDILAIIEDISYIAEYEVLTYNPVGDEEATKKRLQYLERLSFKSIGGNIEQYRQIWHKLRKDTECGMWDPSQKKEKELEIKNIKAFLAAIFDSDIGVAIYKWQDKTKYITSSKTDSNGATKWFIHTPEVYLVSKCLHLIKTSVYDEEEEEIYSIEGESPSEFVALAAALFNIYDNYADSFVYMRANIFWGSEGNGHDASIFLFHKLGALEIEEDEQYGAK